MRRRSRITTAVLYIFGISFGFIVLAPLFWLIMLSLKTPLDAFANPPLFIFEPTLKNYQDILADPRFVRSIGNSVIVATGSVLISMVFAIPATYGLANLRGAGRRNTLLWILLTRMAPGMIYLIPYFVIYNEINLIDTHIGLIIIYLIFNVPLMMWMLLPFWEAIPRELSESALIDGANRLQVLLRIDLPLVRTGIIAASILVFIFSWNEFLFALVLTRRDTITLPVTIISFMAYEGTEWGKISAAAVLIMLPVVLFGFMIRRYLISGLTAGAIKG
jgi:multiple sugar transport system permease protein